MINHYFEFVKSLKTPEKFLLIFWLLGPMIFMSGRFLSDLWLTTIVITFISYSIITKNIFWTSFTWMKSLFILVFLFLISSCFSQDAYFCLSETLAWLRFPLFLLAIQVFFKDKKEYCELILLSITFSLIVMLIIGYTEAIFFNKDRLMWPFSNKIPGSYVAKALLPATILFSTVLFSKKLSIRITSLLILFFTAYYVFLTAERMSFIILITSMMIVFYFSSSKTMKIISPLSIIIILGLIILLLGQSENEIVQGKISRYTSGLFLNLTDVKNSDYWAVWFSGINIFFQNPLTGIGPAYMAEICDSVKNVINQNISCQNHPHNYYIQMLAETGFVGPFALLYFAYSISKFCYVRSLSQVSYFWVIPVIFFFPIAQNGDFFAQTGNIFTWFPLSVAVLCSGKRLFEKT